jgi:hypothetical protein
MSLLLFFVFTIFDFGDEFSEAIIYSLSYNPFWSSFAPNKTSVIVLKFRILLCGIKIYKAMRLKTKIQNLSLEFICLLYVLLFAYAAVSKLLDFENFIVQLGQSPLVSAYARLVAYGIPFLELLIAFLLLFSKWRLIGLYGALSLMVLFSTYIFIILNFSFFVPCSCGGILEKMGWTAHLIFNIVFIILAVIGLILYREQFYSSKINASKFTAFFISQKKFHFSLGATIVCSALLVAVIYMLSEDEIHRNNSFLRRYPHHPISKLHGMPLDYNSYYIAGAANEYIYLGNVTAPLHLLQIDSSLKSVKSIRVRFQRYPNYNFSAVQVQIRSPYFYLSDRTVPVIYRGKITDWTAKLLLDDPINYSLLEPIDSSHFAIRSINRFTNENVLGTLTASTKSHVKLLPQVLKKQVDGVFDTDGLLNYNTQLQKIIYVYYYRNAFFILSKNLKTFYSGKTIDTVTLANLKVVYIQSKREKKLASHLQ